MADIKRHLKEKLLFALQGSPIVYLNGPRQAGKTTLVKTLAQKEYPAEYITFDSTTQMAAASSAPENFLRNRAGALIIDEVQLVPEIFRALKMIVDETRQDKTKKASGHFLLTGSANVMALPKLSDPLVGRMHTLTLYPLSGAEVTGGGGDFISRAFAKNFTAEKSKNKKIIDVIKAATFPEITVGTDAARRSWFDGYLTTILQRDVRALADIAKLSALPNLLRILANRAGGLVNDADIARDAGLNHITTRNYKTLLKMLFLSFDVPPWYRHIGKRLVKAPKGYIIDTSLLCHLLQYDLTHLEINRPEIFGHVLENYVATELLKLIAQYDQNIGLFHFRTSDHKEVDFVLEKPDGTLMGIEVKKQDHVDKNSFAGLVELQRLTGDDFVAGVVLYQGYDVVPFGKNLWAVPLDHLWT